MAKNIVVFADGTGNAFSRQESNIWRLYQALDQSKGNQIARYIPGVGTSEFKYLAALDGAIGYGVPSNVRELYRFICWNWEDGDSIWMFGFSRGAFTIRALAGLIDSQGLMPRHVGDRLVSHEVMQSNSRYAWRAYRKDNANRALPTVTITRAALGVYWSAIKGADHFAKACAEIAGTPRRAPPIEMLGLFDTVEAFGVPVQELKPVIDKLIWPIRFSELKPRQIVRNVRHALALDDERTSFHPVRFDQSHEPSQHERIKEVWFAGMHSDVGGGYPDDTLARVPLLWMTDEAEKLGLHFNPQATKEWKANTSPLGETHDSRAGAAALYRYDPRLVETTSSYGGSAVIHHSVFEKMVHGTENYAPLTILAEKSEVLMPDGRRENLIGPQRKWEDGSHAYGSRQSVLNALSRITAPTSTLLKRAGDVVWWRRFSYFALLWSLLLIALLPWIGDWLRLRSQDAAGKIEDLAGEVVGEAGRSWWSLPKQWLHETVGAIVTLWEWIAGFLPPFAEPWVDAMRSHPDFMLPLVAVAASIFVYSGKLQKAVRDLTHEAWFNKHGAVFSARPQSAGLKLAALIRNSRAAKWLYSSTVGYIFPIFFAFILIGAALIVVHRVSLGAFTAGGNVCSGEVLPKGDEWADLLPGVNRVATRPFDPSSPCWPTGFKVEKGRTYTIWIEAERPFADHLWVAPPQGFSGNGHWEYSRPLGLILKRWPSENWFQPIYQIGQKRLDEGVLKPVDGLPAPLLSKQDRMEETKPIGKIQTWTNLSGADLTAAQSKLSEPHRKPQLFQAELTAKISGPLHIYINDAMIGIPLYGALRSFYRNNEGKAKVTIRQRVAHPP